MLSTSEAVEQTLGKRELGRLAALTLMEEMRFLSRRQRTANDNQLIDGAERPDFQKIHAEAAAKSDMASSFIMNAAGLRFCIASGGVHELGLLDIDHTIAYHHITEKQKSLLAYLNADGNKEFAEGFLSAQRQYQNENGEDVSESIRKYFGKDANGRIKGSGYFYSICYNDIDNLLLLAHHYNLSKGKKDSLQWFGEQEPFLGQRFVDGVREAGGLHEGVIVQKVMNRQGKNTVKIGEVECVLHAGEGVGLGRFINEWFDRQNPGYRKDAIIAFEGIWLEYKGVLEDRVWAEDPEGAMQAKLVSDTMGMTLRECIKVVQKHYGFKSSSNAGGSSPSDSDGSDDLATRIKNIDKKVKDMLTEMHDAKKLYKAIPEQSRMSKIDYYALLIHSEESWAHLQEKEKRPAMKEMLEAVKKLGPEAIPEDTARTLREIIHAHSTEALRERADQEAKARQEEAKARQEAEKARQEAERRADELADRLQAITGAHADQEAQVEKERSAAASPFLPSSSSVTEEVRLGKRGREESGLDNEQRDASFDAKGKPLNK